MSFLKIKEISDKYFYAIENLKTDKIRADDHLKRKEKDLKLALESEAYADLGIIKDFMHYLEINLTSKVKDYQLILLLTKYFKDVDEELRKTNTFAEIEQLISENRKLREDMDKIKSEYLLKEAKLMQGTSFMHSLTEKSKSSELPKEEISVKEQSGEPSESEIEEIILSTNDYYAFVKELKLRYPNVKMTGINTTYRAITRKQDKHSLTQDL